MGQQLRSCLKGPIFTPPQRLPEKVNVGFNRQNEDSANTRFKVLPRPEECLRDIKQQKAPVTGEVSRKLKELRPAERKVQDLLSTLSISAQVMHPKSYRITLYTCYMLITHKKLRHRHIQGRHKADGG